MSKRSLLFWLVCIPVRLCIAVSTFRLQGFVDRLHAAFEPFLGHTPTWEVALGLSWPYMCVGFGFIITTHARDTVGLLFGGKVWWFDMRPVHAICWTFAWGCVLSGAYEIAGTALLIDVLIGVVARVDKVGYS